MWWHRNASVQEPRRNEDGKRDESSNTGFGVVVEQPYRRPKDDPPTKTSVVGARQRRGSEWRRAKSLLLNKRRPPRHAMTKDAHES